MAWPPVKSDVSVQVIGGEDAVDGEYPWMGALIRNGEDSLADRQFCGCVLIDPNWVLTAAHCVDEAPLDSFVIALGDENLAGEPKIVSPRVILVNPGSYHRTSRGGDLALIQLEEPVVDIDPVAIRTGLEGTSLPETGRIVGWGRTGETVGEEPVRPAVLQVADVPIYDYLDPFIVDNWRTEYLPEFTAIGSLDPMTGASSGDSGGPLLVEAPDGDGWVVAGIDSWGANSESELAPLSMYTDLAVYNEWIREVVDEGGLPSAAFGDWGFDTGVFKDISAGGRPGLRFWPFAAGNARGIAYSGDLRDWRDFEFRFNTIELYQTNNDGSYTIYPDQILGGTESVFVRYWDSEQPHPRSGIFPLPPYQKTRGSVRRSDGSVLGQNQTVFKLTGLEVGRTYSAAAWSDSGPESYYSVIERSPTENKILIHLRFGRFVRQRPFVPREGYDYWLLVEGAGPDPYEFELYIQEISRVPVELSVWHDGVLEVGDSPFRRPSVLADAYFVNRNLEGDVKIELDSVFDAEMGIYESGTGKQIAYYDREAENELETLVVYGEDLSDNSFKIFNFDHNVFGSYRFRILPITEKSVVPVGTDERRAITANDRVNLDDPDEPRYFEFIEIEQTDRYSSITATVDGVNASLASGIWDYNLEGYLENDFGGFNTHTFTPEMGNRYFVYVAAPQGRRNVNYEFKVTGTEIVEDPDDPGNVDPIDLGESQSKRPAAENDPGHSGQPEYLPLPLDLR